MCVLQGVASLVAQLVKNLPAMQGTPVPFLVREDPLECVCMCVCVGHSVVSDSVTLWSVVPQAPLSM